MNLTGEHVLEIQKFLVRKGIQCTGPSTEWRAQAQEAYFYYQGSLGIPYPRSHQLPTMLADLSPELREHLQPKPVVETPVQVKAPEAPKAPETLKAADAPVPLTPSALLPPVPAPVIPPEDSSDADSEEDSEEEEEDAISAELEQEAKLPEETKPVEPPAIVSKVSVSPEKTSSDTTLRFPRRR